jgi:hypothetical protein
MVQVRDVINRMVDKLVQFAKEVTRVSQVFDLIINLNVSFVFFRYLIFV